MPKLRSHAFGFKVNVLQILVHQTFRTLLILSCGLVFGFASGWLSGSGAFSNWWTAIEIPSKSDDSFLSEGDINQVGKHEKPVEPELISFDYEVKVSVYSTLIEAGFSSPEIHKIVQSAKQLVDLSRIDSGTVITIKRHVQDQQIASIEMPLEVTKTLRLTTKHQEWLAQVVEIPVETRLMAFEGVIESSVWASAAAAGLEAPVIYALADIFAWQIDFEREARPKDSWKIIVERKFIGGEAFGWGNILIAEYAQSGQSYRGIRFPSTGDGGEYFDESGSSLRGVFLKSPLSYGRISSRFQLKRFHPILGVNRPHYGVDYAAPTGTPIRAVGDGRIIRIGRAGGSGKMIKIKHNATYQTAYKHLSRYGKGLRRNSMVKQGDVIGYVGSTGLATGPHLHFEFYENGRYVDPLGKKFPKENPIAKTKLAEFKKTASKALDMLKGGLPDSIYASSGGIVHKAANNAQKPAG